jgi:hypothetical protein
MAGGFGNLMGRAQQLQAKLAEAQAELKDKTVEGLSGGGMVKVIMNGHHEVTSIDLDQEAVDPDDIELLEDLIVAGVADARVKADEMAREEMGRVAQELGLPPALADQLLSGGLGG